MNTKAKTGKGFSILNIFLGVILLMSGTFMLFDPSTGPGGFISLPIGIVLFAAGSYRLSVLKRYFEDERKMKISGQFNFICGIISLVILIGLAVLMVLASIF